VQQQQQVVKGKRKTKRVKDLKVIEIAPKSKYKKLERQNQMLTQLVKEQYGI
jgi:hypothetical protein